MEPRKFTLCPICEACPEVELIDENANTVRLSHAAWNELVRLVKSGELHEV